MNFYGISIPFSGFILFLPIFGLFLDNSLRLFSYNFYTVFAFLRPIFDVFS